MKKIYCDISATTPASDEVIDLMAITQKNIFGNICNFEKGHFEPHILGGANTAGNQCKWCNSFYKDKITWNPETGKPTFNSYAILRDEGKSKIIQNLKLLGFTPKDLE